MAVNLLLIIEAALPPDDGVKITHIYSKYDLKIHYLPNKLTDETYSQIKVLERGLDKKSKEIRSLIKLKYYMNLQSDKLIHGIGCAEDILPTFFKSNGLGQCSPLPFIVTGLIENNKKASLTVVTAVDDIHAPRIIDWNFVFSSIENFSKQHPMRLWGLYALY